MDNPKPPAQITQEPFERDDRHLKSLASPSGDFSHGASTYRTRFPTMRTSSSINSPQEPIQSPDGWIRAVNQMKWRLRLEAVRGACWRKKRV